MYIVKKIWGNKFSQGGIFLTIASFWVNLLNYFFNLIIGRTLGPAGYSEIITLFSYIAILSVPITVFSTLIVQRTGSKDEKRFQFAKEFEQWLIGEIKKVWYIFLPIILIIPFLPWFTNLTPKTAYALFPILILSLMASFYTSSLQGLHFFLAVALIIFFTAPIKLFGPIFNLFFHSLFVILFFLSLSNLFNFLAAKWSFSNVLSKVKLSKRNVKRNMLSYLQDKKLLLSALSILAMALFSNIDIVFAKRFFTAYDAGLYGAWNLLAKVITYFFFPIFSISFVYFSSKKKGEKQQKVFFTSIFLFVIMGILSYFFYRYFAEFTINFFFGDKFVKISPYLSRASLFGISYSVIVYMNDFLIAKESKFTGILPVAVLIYIAGLVLVPKNIPSFITLNLAFATGLALIYLVVSTYWLLYNRAHEKQD